MNTSNELRRSKRSIMRVNRQLPPASRRKNRAVLSCAPCRQRKIKCDRGRPCNQRVRSEMVSVCDYSTRPASPPAARRHSPPPSSPPGPKIASSSTNPDQPPALDQTQNPSTLQNPACWNGNNDRTAAGDLSVGVPGRRPHLFGSGDLGHASPRMHKAPSQPQSFLSFRGEQQRTRFFGRSHFTTTLQMFPDLMNHLQDYRRMKEGPSASRFQEYLRTKHYKKSRRSTATPCHEGSAGRYKARLRDLLPSRQLADYLTHVYLSEYERTFRVVHVPSFLGEWAAFGNARAMPTDESYPTEIFLAKALAMMACASCIADDEDIKLAGSDRSSLSQNCGDWIRAVVSLLGSMPDHARLNLDLIQVKCLLLLARQATAWEGDLVSITAGSLVREATMMGLHRDPVYFPNMSPFQAETRKRLWFTVVEIELQSALHLGVPLVLSWEDFDCPPPSNIEDEDFYVDSPSLVPEKPTTTPTRTTFQIVLARTLSVRMDIAKLINRVRLNIDTTEIVRLSDALTSNMADSPTELREDYYESSTGGAGSCTTFQRSFYLFLMWRSMLTLHRPILLKLASVQNELFLISRRVCVEASIALLAQLESLPEIPHVTSPYPGRAFRPHVLRLRGGLFQDDIFHAAITVCYELRLQLKDTRAPPITGPTSDLITQSASYHRLALFQCIENAVRYFENKIRWEARACKSFSMLCILFMTIKSEFPALATSTNSDDPDPKPLTADEACPKASRRCLELLLEGERLRHLGESPGDKVCQDAPINNPVSDGILQSSAPLGMGDLTGDMEAMAMGNASDMDFRDIDFDWDILLDSMPSYLLQDWPDADPVVQ